MKNKTIIWTGKLSGIPYRIVSSRAGLSIEWYHWILKEWYVEAFEPTTMQVLELASIPWWRVWYLHISLVCRSITVRLLSLIKGV
jgi:hypothetical protein